MPHPNTSSSASSSNDGAQGDAERISTTDATDEADLDCLGVSRANTSSSDSSRNDGAQGDAEGISPDDAVDEADRGLSDEADRDLSDGADRGGKHDEGTDSVIDSDSDDDSNSGDESVEHEGMEPEEMDDTEYFSGADADAIISQAMDSDDMLNRIRRRLPKMDEELQWQLLKAAGYRRQKPKSPTTIRSNFEKWLDCDDFERDCYFLTMKEKQKATRGCHSSLYVSAQI